jgi:hypothetical protein
MAVLRVPLGILGDVDYTPGQQDLSDAAWPPVTDVFNSC